MLESRRPRSRVYLWYGLGAQGVDLFRERLLIELQEKLRDTNIVDAEPEWPEVIDRHDVELARMLCRSLDVNALAEVAARIRTEARRRGGRRNLLLVRHAPVRSSADVSPELLSTYLDWWDANVPEQLGPQDVAVVAIPFEVRDSGAFRGALEQVRADRPRGGTMVRLLPELGKLERKHISDFLKSHGVPLPADRADEEIDRILARTQGSYMPTLDEIKELASRAWREQERAYARTGDKPADPGY